MSETASRRLLVVANRTASAPQLMDQVEQRAREGWQIALMVPPERHRDAPDWTPDEARRLVQRAAGDRPVTLVDCGDDAAATIGTLAERSACDEILLSTPPEHHEHWHRHTLPKRLQAMGMPVTVIPPDSSDASDSHDGFPDKWMIASQIGPST